MVEFQHNSHIYVSTQQCLFILNKGHLPKMGFKLHWQRSKLESIMKFTEQMKSTLEEAKVYHLQVDAVLQPKTNPSPSLSAWWQDIPWLHEHSHHVPLSQTVTSLPWTLHGEVSRTILLICTGFLTLLSTIHLA